MNWDAVSAIGEVFGGLLVLATLLFLAHQIRQSNRLGQAEAQRDWFAKWHDIMRATAETADVATLFRKGLHSYSTLEKSEKAVFSGYLISMLDHADVLRRLNEQKLVADDMTQPVIKVCQAFISTPGGKDWWNEVGHVMTIYQYMESLPNQDVQPMTDVFSYYAE